MAMITLDDSQVSKLRKLLKDYSVYISDNLKDSYDRMVADDPVTEFHCSRFKYWCGVQDKISDAMSFLGGW